MDPLLHVVLTISNWDGSEFVGAGCQLVATASMRYTATSFLPCGFAETAAPQADSAQPASIQSAHMPPGPAVSTATDDTKNTMQARAQHVQGGNLTSLLMAWFEAGYQTGRHEALSQNL